MTGLLVVDASALVAALIEHGERGEAAVAHMRTAGLVAPDLLGYEVLNALRRRRAAGQLAPRDADQARRDCERLEIELWSLTTIAARLWELTGSMSAYDAAYVALAEKLGAPLLTADRRLAAAPAIKAEVVVV